VASAAVHYADVCIFLPFSQDLTFKALLLSMEQVTKYGEMYRAAIVEFKIRHFEDRSKVMMGLIIFMFYVYLILIMLNAILIPYFCFSVGQIRTTIIA